ncbi:MAG: restriction endonuclease [bacterium]|nr:restriction endonuclease [bacterium]
MGAATHARLRAWGRLGCDHGRIGQSPGLPNYTGAVGHAVAQYWNVRATQARRSQDQGVLNTGLRSEVTGGRHLDALQTLLVQVFVDGGIPAHLMEVKRRPIPGYFRRDKSWDVVVMVDARVVGIIELKSIVGDSPGQNFNNRTDEALGQAMDVWTAVERGIIDTPLRPWLGYFMLLEDNEAFNKPVAPRRPVWPSDPAFDDASYAKRFEIFFDRMVRERLLDAACLILGRRDDASVSFTSDTLSFQAFAAAIHGRCLQFKTTNPDLPWED